MPSPSAASPVPDLDATIAPVMADAVASLDGGAPLLAGMVRYHLGEAGADLQPLPEGSVNRGKRIRPAVALLAAGAAGGDPLAAAPAAAAIELLHNFTLIHDDVQDESPTRRHRDTVWNLWGIGQAINAGDALFAAAHLPLYRIAGRDPALAVRLVEAFDRMTIGIVTGQTLDLGFEGRDDVSPADYLAMIEGKTALIVRYAAWAGAVLGGADGGRADQFGEFGLALGLGFQLQDDALGIWGAEADTGKAPADDIRRRKQSLPILLLRQRLGPGERAELDRLYAEPEIGPEGIARVLALLAACDVQAAIAAEVAREHDRARDLLLAAAAPGPNPCRDALLALVERLALRIA
ncbi:MAG: polyprenyl synthetase family protein [Chloroflexota bacterium]